MSLCIVCEVILTERGWGGEETLKSFAYRILLTA